MSAGLLVGVGLLVAALLLMAWLDVATRPRARAAAGRRRRLGPGGSSGGLRKLTKAMRRLENDLEDHNDDNGHGHDSGSSFGCGGGGGGGSD